MRRHDEDLEQHWGEDERHRRAQERAVREAPERNQEETDERVEDEDVAFPDVQVHGADRHEHEQAPLEDAQALVAAAHGGGKLQREADAEEEGKERVELAVAEPDDQSGDGQVDRGRRRRGHHLGRHERKAAEDGEVQEEDAAEREAAQGVEHLQAIAVRRRPNVEGRRDCARGRVHGSGIRRAWLQERSVT